MELLTQYLDLQQQIYDYFGYVEDWRVLPLDDASQYFWVLDEKDGFVHFASTESDGNFYLNKVYTADKEYARESLAEWMYRAEDYILICVDTRVDLNQFLRVFDNSKERKLKGEA